MWGVFMEPLKSDCCTQIFTEGIAVCEANTASWAAAPQGHSSRRHKKEEQSV